MTANNELLNKYMTGSGDSDALDLIKQRLPRLNPALMKIGKYILEDPDASKSFTTKEMSQACQVSESTVTRFVKEIGFTNYQELKIKIAEALQSKKSTSEVSDNHEYIYENIAEADTVDNIMEKLIYKNVATLSETRNLAEPDAYKKAAQAIKNAEILSFSCTGSSAVAAEEAMMRFTRAGKKCIFHKDSTMQQMATSILGNKDVIVGISDSGDTISVINSLRQAKKKDITTIAVTSNNKSKLCDYADIVLLTPGNDIQSYAACDNWENTSSKISQILVIDVLYALYAVGNYDEIKENLDMTYKAISYTRKH